jgi:hypothetical protein
MSHYKKISCTFGDNFVPGTHQSLYSAIYVSGERIINFRSLRRKREERSERRKKRANLVVSDE